MDLTINEIPYDSKSAWWLDINGIFLSKENWWKLLFYTRGKNNLVISVETLYSIVGLEIVFFPMSLPTNMNKFKQLYEMYSVKKYKCKSKLWKI